MYLGCAGGEGGLELGARPERRAQEECLRTCKTVSYMVKESNSAAGDSEPGKKKRRGCAGNVGRTETAQVQLMAGRCSSKINLEGRGGKTNRPFTRQTEMTLWLTPSELLPEQASFQ